MKLAQSEETAVQEACLLSSGTKKDSIQVHHVAHESKVKLKLSTCKDLHLLQVQRTDGHNMNKCGAINSTYNIWKKVGHLQVCCSKPKSAGSTNQNRHRQRPAKNEKKFAAWKQDIGLKSARVMRANQWCPSKMLTAPPESKWIAKGPRWLWTLVVSTTSYHQNYTNCNLRAMNWIQLKTLYSIWRERAIEM